MESVPVGLEEISNINTGNGKKSGFGFWKTTFLSILVLMVNLFVSTGITLIYIIFTMEGDELIDALDLIQGMMNDGFYLSLTIIGSAIACCFLIFLIVMFKRDITVKDYLGFKGVTKRTVILSLVIVIAYIFVADFVTHLIGNEITTDWMEHVYVSSIWPPLLWSALIIFAPVFEEMLFRGFLFKGYLQSKLGPIGTIIITSAAWTGLHVQYGIFGLASIFVIGLIFGTIRYKTGSLWIVIVMHAFYNLIATIQIALYVNGLPG